MVVSVTIHLYDVFQFSSSYSIFKVAKFVYLFNNEFNITTIFSKKKLKIAHSVC